MAKYTAKQMAEDNDIVIGDLRRYLKASCKKPKGQRLWQWKSKKASAADLKRVKAYMKPKKADMGRPSGYTEELGDLICKGIAQGKSLRTICIPDDMPAESSVYKWRREFRDFSENYARAREDAGDVFAEDIINISDNAGSIVIVDGIPLMDAYGNPVMQVDSAAIAHARLRTDTRKWVASKFNKAYQDKTVIEDVTPIPTPEERKDRINVLLAKAISE